MSNEFGTANIDWLNLGFNYLEVPFRFHARYKDGQWSQGELTEDKTFSISEGATALNYGQQVFEGMKARATAKGDAVLFRPEANAERMQRSARRLSMIPVPKALFIEGVKAVTKANAAFVPPYTAGEAAFYLRPLLIGIGDNLGLQPAKEYLFIVYGCPVGSYFTSDSRSIRLTTCAHDRAATRGTGHIKAGGNYASSLLDRFQAKDAGFDEVLYLDSATRQFIDEAGSANIFAIKDKTLIIPQSSSILPSITRLSLVELAEDSGFEVINRPVRLDEIDDFDELGCCGTAVTIASVSHVRADDKIFSFPTHIGPHSEHLYRVLTAIQTDSHEAPSLFKNWISYI